jgi:hypothetical protein
MKNRLLIIAIALLFTATAKAQHRWGFYINAAKTNIINKDANYTKTAFNSIGNFEQRQPFYGSFIRKSATWHKSFGVWYKLPIKREKINYYAVIGVGTYGHKEELNGGKVEDYPYAFYRNLPPGDTAIQIINKYRNYFFNVGFKTEIKIYSKIFTEMQANYLVNKNNQDKLVKAFRSVFDYSVLYQDGYAKGKDIPYNDVNYTGILFLQGGINYQVIQRMKLHLLYSISLTPVNKYTHIKKLYYNGIALQISYSAW